MRQLGGPATALVRTSPWSLALVAAVAIVVYGTLGTLLHGPSVFGDELVYQEAARSLAHDGAPLVRGEPYGFGLLYPAVLAPAMLVARNQVQAYALAKLTNALFFSLTAIPAYLLGRRLLSRAWSFGVAVLAIAVPSGLYTGLVLTESVSYLAVTTAFLSIVRALERPTLLRQLLAVAAVALSVVARPQFIALAAALALALPLNLLFTKPSRRQLWHGVRGLWGFGLAAIIGAATLVVAAHARGVSLLGSYGDVVHSYKIVQVARASWYSLGGLELYLGFVPFVAAPAALVYLVRRARTGSVESGAFAAVFLAANATLIVEVAALMTTPLLGGLLHDRYLFYLVPLWLTLFAAWLQARAPSTRRQLGIGGGLAILLAATLPARLIVGESARIDGIATALWVKERAVLPAHPAFVRGGMVIAALVAMGAVWLLAPRARMLLLLPVAAVFVANAVLVWRPRVADAGRPIFSNGSPRSWVDRLVPAGSKVDMLWIQSATCPSSVRDAFRWTEFFNERVGSAAQVGDATYVPLSSTNVGVAANGVLRTSDGRAFESSYVVTMPGVVLDGTTLGQGTSSRLRLWHVDGPVRVRGVRSTAQLQARSCASVSGQR